ncbi:hypothetical protein FDE74_07290 [Clostridium botulinum]|nr:hypothetical protein [Clostridium botulinum]
MNAKDKIRIKVSEKGYSKKPDVDEIKKITWQMKNNNSRSIDYKELAGILSQGHSVLLADFKEVGNIKEDNISSLSCVALDIDSKENRINIYEMISKINVALSIYPILSYCTFSDKDGSKFRLIYRLENNIDVETYRTLYLSLQWKFKKYLDPATKNANRIWAGTDKGVTYVENDVPISFDKIIKLIRGYHASLKRKDKRRRIVSNSKYKEFHFDNDIYIKPEHKEEVMKYLIDSIDLREFMPKHLGGIFKRNGDKLIGSCVLHGGDNETALVISRDRYTCFTHCGSGNIITVARKVYNIDNFLMVAFKLLAEHNLNIPSEYVREVHSGEGNNNEEC